MMIIRIASVRFCIMIAQNIIKLLQCNYTNYNEIHKIVKNCLSEVKAMIT